MAAAHAMNGVVRSLDDARRRRFLRDKPGELIRVMVVVEHAIHRAGVRALLEHDLGVVVAGEAGSTDEAARLAAVRPVDVVLLDADCLERSTTALTLSLGRVAVLVLIDDETDDRLLTALRAGAAGVLSKDSDPDELISAVRTVARGGALVPPLTARRLIDELIDTTWAPAR